MTRHCIALDYRCASLDCQLIHKNYGLTLFVNKIIRMSKNLKGTYSRILANHASYYHTVHRRTMSSLKTHHKGYSDTLIEHCLRHSEKGVIENGLLTHYPNKMSDEGPAKKDTSNHELVTEICLTELHYLWKSGRCSLQFCL